MDVPRAQVTEKDGEVSCSVEETNRIRLMLGLKPLEVGSSSSKMGEVVVHRAAPAADAGEDVRARIERAKREREVAAQVKTKSLGESLKAQQLSAADWVSQSRKQGLIAKAKEELASRHASSGGAVGGGGVKRPRPQDYSARDLAGLRIRHDVDTIAEGGDGVVLTLADRGVLEEDGRGVMRLTAEGEDELVNIELADREKAQHANDRRKNLKKPMYSGLDEDEFGGAGGSGASTRAVLAQYDEDVDGNSLDPASRQAKLVIAADGSVADNKGAEAVRARLVAAAAARAATVDLRGDRREEEGPKLATDTMTQAEFAALVRPKKKRAVRSADAEEEAPAAGHSATVAGESTPVSQSERLIAELQRQKREEAGGAGGDGSRDRGSRARREGGSAVSKMAEEEAAITAGKASAYAQAQARANAKAGAAMGMPPATSGVGAGRVATSAPPGGASHTAKPLHLPSALPSLGGEAGRGATGHRVYARLRATGGGWGEEEEGDDDAALQAMLAKSRKVAQQSTVTMAKAAQAAFLSRPLPHPAAPFLPQPPALGDAGGSEGEGDDDHGKKVAQRVSVCSKPSGGDVDMAGAQEGPDEARGMTFTSLTEFSRRLQAQVLERAEEASEAASAAGKAAGGQGGSSSAAAPVEEEGDDGADDMDVSGDEEEDEEGEDEEGEEGSDTASNAGGAGRAYSMGFTGEDPARRAGTGLAAAMHMFASTGAIQTRELFAGRANDMRPEADAPADKNIILEYKDEFGRKLTPKEAYRQLSYKFHGRMPSKSTRDKRMKKMLREQALTKAAATMTGGSTTSSLTGMQRVQEVTGSAFVSLGK